MLVLSRLIRLALATTLACSVTAAQAPLDHVRESVRLMQAGDLSAAADSAKLALEYRETEAVANAILGSIRVQQDLIEEGAELLGRAVEIDPNLLGARLNLAQAYELLERPDKAESMYRSVLAAAPDNAVARLAVIRAAGRKGRHQEAVDLASPVETVLRSSPDGLLVLARSYVGVGDRDRAVSLISDWNRLTGVAPDWTIKFALSLAKGGLTREAIQILEAVKAEGYASFELAFNLADLYLHEEDSKQASENFELALTYNDRSLPALRQVARIAEEAGNYEKALAFLIRAKLEAPDDPDVLFAFGAVALRMELLQDGTNALERARELRPDHKSTRYWLGTARGANREFDAALELYKGLLAEVPDDPMLHYAVGSVHYLKVEFDPAAQYLRESCRLDPDQLMSYYFLAMIEQKQGRDAEAIKGFESILERYPDHALSHEGLAVSLMKETRYAEARDRFERALALNPQSARASYQLGQLLVRMGMREEAQRQLADAKSLREEEERSQLVRTLLNPH